jgi:hypothetical protein
MSGGLNLLGGRTCACGEARDRHRFTRCQGMTYAGVGIAGTSQPLAQPDYPPIAWPGGSAVVGS